MYQITLDFRNSTVVISMGTVAALMFPDMVNFIYNREKGIIGLAKGAVELPTAGGSRGRRRQGLGIRLSEIWDKDADCFCVQCSSGTLAVLGERIPGRDPLGKYIMDGELICETVIGFDVAAAVPAIDPDKEVKGQ